MENRGRATCYLSVIHTLDCYRPTVNGALRLMDLTSISGPREGGSHLDHMTTFAKYAVT